MQHWKHVIAGQYSRGQYNATLERLIYISLCNIGGPGLLTASHRHKLDRRCLISSCNPGWLRSTPCHNRSPGGCLLGDDRLVQDTTAGQGFVCWVLTDLYKTQPEARGLPGGSCQISTATERIAFINFQELVHFKQIYV